MGNKQTIFSEIQLELYQDVTFFRRNEILRVFERFRELSPERIPLDMSGKLPSTIYIERAIICGMPELKENPFGERIVRVFSSDPEKGDMTFNDFLDMFSVFSEAAAKEIKAEYAFKIYDFDGDGELGRQDLLTTARTLSGGELEESEMRLIVDKVMEEVDDDMDGSVSLAEFQQIVQRAADFTTQFHIRI